MALVRLLLWKKPVLQPIQGCLKNNPFLYERMKRSFTTTSTCLCLQISKTGAKLGFPLCINMIPPTNSTRWQWFSSKQFLADDAGVLRGQLSGAINNRDGPPAAPPLTPEEEFRAEQEWTWAAPTRVKRQGPAIPVKVGVRLTKEEVLKGLEEAGGEDLECINIADSNMAESMIFATGKSPLHLRRMADILVNAVKQRKLRDIPAYTGAEGYGVDDGWILVDTEDLIIQLMDTGTRRDLKLEDHWRNIDKFRERCSTDAETFVDELLPTESDIEDNDVNGIEEANEVSEYTNKKI